MKWISVRLSQKAWISGGTSMPRRAIVFGAVTLFAVAPITAQNALQEKLASIKQLLLRNAEQCKRPMNPSSRAINGAA